MYVETTGITKQGTRPTSRETSPWNCGSDATTDALMRRPATPGRISLWSLLRQERGDPARVQHRKEELRMGNGSEKFGRGNRMWALILNPYRKHMHQRLSTRSWNILTRDLVFTPFAVNHAARRHVN